MNAYILCGTFSKFLVQISFGKESHTVSNIYFQMEEKDIIEYTLLKATAIDWDRASMKVIIPKEHGNLNYVYRVTDGKGNSIYIKQAGTETRISKDMKPSRDRNRLESEILMLQDSYAKGMVPYIYFYARLKFILTRYKLLLFLP